MQHSDISRRKAEKARTFEALHTFRSEMERLNPDQVARSFGANRIITGEPNSQELRRELERVDFPIDTPIHIIHATRDFSLANGVFPPALITTQSEAKMSEWCELVNEYRETYGVRTAQKQLEEHEEIIVRMARHGHDPIAIARHLGCRTENVSNFLKRKKIKVRKTIQAKLLDDAPVGEAHPTGTAPTQLEHPRPRLRLVPTAPQPPQPAPAQTQLFVGA